MKLNKRIFVLLLTVILVFTTTTSAFAQTSNPEAVLAGDTVSVVFAYEDIAGINGTFTYSNSSIIEKVEISQEVLSSGDTNGAMIGDKVNEELQVNYYQHKVADICEITLDITIADTAKAGDSCTITFEYETTVDGDLPAVPVYSYDYATITVGSRVDYTELNNQIEIAEKLDELAHSKKSWEDSNIEELLAKAIAARTSDSQDEVDAAAEALKGAIAAVKLMDEAELNKQIAAAEALVAAGQGTYTNDTWNAMLTALDNAKDAVGCRVQETVDQAAKTLADAIAALKGVDYTELNTQIEIAEKLDELAHSKKSWEDSNIEDLLAKAIAARNSNSQDEVDAAAEALKGAIAAVKLMDEAELNKQIAAAEALVAAGQGTYTNDTWNAMLTALENAKNASGCRVQETVDQAAKTLADAIDALKEVNYSVLNDLIAKAEELSKEKDKYTAESWKAVEDALSAAKDALASRDQAVVDAAAEALGVAIAGLKEAPVVVPVDYTVLKELIGKAEKLNEADYTKESWANLVAALKAAKAALESDDQDVVDAAAAALRNAIEALKIPPTGDTFTIMLTLAILAALTIAVMFVVRSKRKLRVR